MSIRFIKVLTLSSLLLSTAVSSAVADEWRNFSAVVIEYTPGKATELKRSSFKSKVSVFEQGAVKVIQIKNFISGKRKHDALIKIAISSNSMGSIIYDSQNKPIAEYGNGKIVSDTHYMFEQELKDGVTVGRWFIEEDYIMSDISYMDKEGNLLYKETVIYIAKRPKKKKRK